MRASRYCVGVSKEMVGPSRPLNESVGASLLAIKGSGKHRGYVVAFKLCEERASRCCDARAGDGEETVGPSRPLNESVGASLLAIKGSGKHRCYVVAFKLHEE